MTISCPNCKRYVTVVVEADGSRWMYVGDKRHVCGESDRSAY